MDRCVNVDDVVGEECTVVGDKDNFYGFLNVFCGVVQWKILSGLKWMLHDMS